MDLFGSICLTDIPKELIREGKNGKKYLSIEVRERREVGRFGDTHYVKAYCKKDERKDDVNYFIGDLKPSSYGTENAAMPQPATEKAVPGGVSLDDLMKMTSKQAPAQSNDDDLPF